MVFAFYGSLKSGQYNYYRFMLTRYSNILSKEKVKGFSMYSLGSYPTIVPDKNGEIEVELHEIENKHLAKVLDDMEIYAGYKKKKITVKGIKATIYYMDNIPSYSKKIENGIWNGTNL